MSLPAPEIIFTEPPPRRPPHPLAGGAATVVVALAASLFLLFVIAPVVGLVSAGGVRGLASFGADRELRASLWLTVVTATTATILGVVGGTPVAYLLARRRRTTERLTHS